ncbi:phosphoglycerate kinase [Candidatus Daviesbacteria bacterium]|nr:phosphoglycerate kinase [Candidatus Daviesbacteria bacterium]
MQVVTPDVVKGKKVLLRLDLDVPIKDGKVEEDFRLRAGIPTITLIHQNASRLILIGHLGRPSGADPNFSLKPVHEWFRKNHFNSLSFEEDSSFVMLENTRFDKRENEGSQEYAKELASQADFYVNEAFAAHNSAVSTTLLPTLFTDVLDPEGRLRSRRAAGLHFAKEVEKLLQVRNTPKKPLLVILGGAKLEDKLGVLNLFSQTADAVLVGGKLPQEIRAGQIEVSKNVMVAKMIDNGLDISTEATESFAELIKNAAQIIWAGPLGKYEEENTILGTKEIAEAILQSSADIIVGGGDTIAALNKLNLLSKFQQNAFVSTGGGAMLRLLSEGTLPTIAALDESIN